MKHNGRERSEVNFALKIILDKKQEIRKELLLPPKSNKKIKKDRGKKSPLGGKIKKGGKQTPPFPLSYIAFKI